MANFLTPGADYLALACGVFIFNEEGKFLMTLRSKNTRADRFRWGIPGGLVEFNERIEDAIRREAMEETGVTITSVEPIGYVDHILKDENKHFVSQLFVATTYTGTPTNMEPDKFDAFEWFDVNALPENTSEIVRNGVRLYAEWTKREK
jgi:ADP-ribose pyrophosphatase YjhB (NUDIX family)